MTNEQYLTPVCIAKFLWIYTPNTRFDSNGTYSITCVMVDSQPWAHLTKLIQSSYDEYYAAQCVLAKSKLKKSPHIPWKTTKQGERHFTVKNDAVGVKKDGTKFTVKPTILAPDKTILTQDMLSGTLASGTKVRVGFALNLWNNSAQGVGMSARLKAVQIIEPVYFDGIGKYTDPETGEEGGFDSIPADWFKPKDKSGGVSFNKLPDEFLTEPDDDTLGGPPAEDL